jgi:DNA-binding NarL/FixJ family response regulator
MRLMICASLAIVRECLRTRLEAEPDMEVVGEAAACGRVADAVRDLHADVLLVQADTPGFAPTEVVQAVAAARSGTRVIVLGRKDDPRVRALLQIGIAGYLSDEATIDDLLVAVRATPTGLTTVDPAAARTIADDGMLDRPTARQLEVVLLVAQGETNRSIADRLGVAERTVEFHLRRLFVKVGAASRTELVTRGRELGWLA